MLFNVTVRVHHRAEPVNEPETRQFHESAKAAGLPTIVPGRRRPVAIPVHAAIW